MPWSCAMVRRPECSRSTMSKGVPFPLCKRTPDVDFCAPLEDTGVLRPRVEALVVLPPRARQSLSTRNLIRSPRERALRKQPPQETSSIPKTSRFWVLRKGTGWTPGIASWEILFADRHLVDWEGLEWRIDALDPNGRPTVDG